MRRLINAFRKRPGQSPKRRNRRLGLESMEKRRLLVADAAFGTLGVLATDFELPTSQGSIAYNASNRNVTVEGVDFAGDAVYLTIDNRSTASTSDDLLTVSLSNVGRPLSSQFRVVDVNRVFVNVYGGDDLIDNRTSVSMTAYGGTGRDAIFGGGGLDALVGGDGDDYLDGRGGSDSIWGQRGVDALFGDDGNDALFGGDDTDYLFGGNGGDSLYGELGADRLYGGAGADKLTDPYGMNVLYTDYGPNNTVSASGFQAFDWFDRNLQDATLRTLTRSQYRDGVISRLETLEIYRTAASDSVVTTNEVADLKDLVGTRLNMPEDTRFLANKVANGDRANGAYKGATLGNLTAGSADRLNKLVDKWFKGGDVPAVDVADTQYAWASGSLFVDGPSYLDVRQGKTGDCYFLVALGEIAEHSSSTLNNMFVDNGDGTYTVRFYRDGAAQYVTVNRLLPVNKFGFAVYAGWGGQRYDMPTNELWVALAEKAYAQLNASGWTGQNGVNSYAGIDLGQTAIAFKQVSGKSATVSSLSYSGIQSALSSGNGLALSTKDSGVASGIVPNHEYMVIGYNYESKKFQLYQPAGSAFKPAAIDLSWSEIVANFQGSTTVRF